MACSRLADSAWVYGNARVSGDAWVKSPLFIAGSRHSLTNAKKGHVQIGCECRSYDWWLGPKGEEFARDNGYSLEEIGEYRAYLELFKRVGK